MSKPIQKFKSDYIYFESFTTRWRDNDVYGHMNNVVFYEFADSIVNNWIKKFGGLNVPESETIGLVVKTQCDYFSGLTFPNGVDCGLVCQDKGYSSVTYEVALFNQCDEAAAAQIKFVHVYVDAITRKAVALPKSLEKALLKISRY